VAREDNFSITANVDGERLGVFQTFAGGETDSEETRNYPGAMQAQESLGGPRTVGNVTVARRFKPDRDAALVKRLRSKVGRATAQIMHQPLDASAAPLGQPEVFTGTLKRVGGPQSDSNATGVAMFELEITPDGTVG
jgi:hypothetical protein